MLGLSERIACVAIPGHRGKFDAAECKVRESVSQKSLEGLSRVRRCMMSIKIIIKKDICFVK